MVSVTNLEEQYNLDMVEGENIVITIDGTEYYNKTIGTGKEGKVTFAMQIQDTV